MFPSELEISCSIQILERAVQPFWPRYAPSTVCRGLSERHPRRDTAVGGATGFTQAGRTKLLPVTDFSHEETHLLLSFFSDYKRWLLPYVLNRKLLNWSRSRGGGVFLRKQPPLIRAPQLGLVVMTWCWPTPLRTTTGTLSPAAPASPEHQTAAWFSCPKTWTSHLKTASPTAATRSQGSQTWAAVHPSVRTAPGIRTLMRLPTQLPKANVALCGDPQEPPNKHSHLSNQAMG